MPGSGLRSLTFNDTIAVCTAAIINADLCLLCLITWWFYILQQAGSDCEQERVYDPSAILLFIPLSDNRSRCERVQLSPVMTGLSGRGLFDRWMMTHTQLLPEPSLSCRFDSFSPQINEIIISKLHFMKSVMQTRYRVFVLDATFILKANFLCVWFASHPFVSLQLREWNASVCRVTGFFHANSTSTITRFLMQHRVCDQFDPLAFPTFPHWLVSSGSLTGDWGLSSPPFIQNDMTAAKPMSTATFCSHTSYT